MTRNTIIDRLKESDRAVSPVIGVILMVAITVILAAVIGTFVLDLGQSAGNQAPSASLTVSADTATGNLTVAHKGGDALQSENTRVIVEVGGTSQTFAAGGDSSFAVGDEAIVNVSGDNELVWDSSNIRPGQTAAGSDIPGITSGDQVNIQVIDTNSQRVIFETTLTA